MKEGNIMSKTKACVGLSNIHFAPFNGGEFETPVRISHAKKIENKFKYENIQEWADNIAVINEFLYGGGEGSFRWPDHHHSGGGQLSGGREHFRHGVDGYHEEASSEFRSRISAG